ncbi:MAG: AAA family ATPase, partial [Waddliaceae bacterium]
MEIPNFTLQEMLPRNDRYCLFRAMRDEDRQPVLIKTTISDHPFPFEIARLKHEYEMMRELKGRKRLVESYALVPVHRQVALVMEHVKGILLEQLIRSQKIDTEKGLMIAIEIAKGVRDIHRANIIHKDLQPQNIMVDPVTNTIKVIDFRLSTRLEREIISAKAPESIEGSLEYISPEQTGRVNREVTYRTDFYSLGVLLYEIFTGRPPFTSPVPLDLIHQHMTKDPLPPHHIDPDIPMMISTIILKLLEKNAEDRYKSAGGLVYDLENCLQQFEKNQAIAPFALCQKDVPEHLFIPEKLYGREKHIETLFKRFEQTVSGKCQLVLVSGESGIGKSVLIQEIQRPLSKMGGYFISGKCDQFKQGIFYHAIIQAFQQLMQLILSESPASIAEWRRKILKAVGPNGQLIIDVVPSVEEIIGKQQPLPQLPPKETRDRFHYYLQAFIQVFIAKEHPLILFLDDLQWIDLASLRLLIFFLTDPTIGHLLILGAYHGQKYLSGHSLVAAIEEVKRRAPNVIEIELHPLHQYSIGKLLADTFDCPMEKVDPLAQAIKEKTEGNPFFIKELLKNLLIHQVID